MRSRHLLVGFFVLVPLFGIGCGAGDSDPPTVSATNPAALATAVALNATVQVTFSEEMDPASVTSSTFSVGSSSGLAGGSFSWDSTNTIVTFTPSSNFSESTTYTVNLSEGVTDASGNPLAATSFSFTTVDLTSPTLSSSSPAAGASGVALNSGIQVIFLEEMNPDSVTASTFVVTTSGSSAVGGSFSWDSTHTIVTFTPSSNLSEVTTYTVSLGSGITDLAGNPLAATSYSFTTGDFTAPTVSSCTPASGATGISKTTTMSCTFSEALSPSTVTSSNVSLTAGGSAVSGAIALSNSNRTVTFTPTGNLTQNTQNCINFTTGIQDANGVALANSAQSCFTTLCSSSDDFSSSNSLGCFTLYKYTTSAATQETNPGSFYDSVSISGGTFNLDRNTTATSSSNGYPLHAKPVVGNFSVEMVVSGGLPSTSGDRVSLVVINSAGDDTLDIDFGRNATATQIFATSRVNAGTLTSLASTALSASTIYLKMTRSGASYTLSYKTSGSASYTDLVTSDRSSNSSDSLTSSTETLFVGIQLASESSGALVSMIDAFNFLSGSAVGQE